MNDNTAIVIVTIIISACTLLSCGEPDLIDAYRERVMAQTSQMQRPQQAQGEPEKVK